MATNLNLTNVVFDMVALLVCHTSKNINQLSFLTRSTLYVNYRERTSVSLVCFNQLEVVRWYAGRNELVSKID